MLAHEAMEFTQRLRAIVTRDVIVEDHHRRGRTVLLVEDNAVNQRVAQLFLERAGCDVVLAADGSEALAMLESRARDLVLMDVQMPVMDGLKATRRIRAESGRRRIPIVGLTANAMSEQVEACRAAGMDDVSRSRSTASASMRCSSAMRRRSVRAPGATSFTRVWSARLPSARRQAARSLRRAVPRSHDGRCGPGARAGGEFRAQCAAGLRRPRDGLERSDFALAKRAAHTLVGASANMGAERLEAIAAAMEQAASHYDGVTLRPLIAAARQRCDAALAELRSLL